MRARGHALGTRTHSLACTILTTPSSNEVTRFYGILIFF